jgi:DNA-binding MarR family transcriptional regulator
MIGVPEALERAGLRAAEELLVGQAVLRCLGPLFHSRNIRVRRLSVDREDLLALQRATHGVLRALDDELRDLGLSPSEINALACLDPPDGLRIGDLASATAQRASTVTGIVDRLERRGLVERVLVAADRRTVHVRLTPRGRTAHGDVVRGYERVAARAGAGLGAGEAATFRAALAALERTAAASRG